MAIIVQHWLLAINEEEEEELIVLQRINFDELSSIYMYEDDRFDDGRNDDNDDDDTRFDKICQQ